MAQYTHYYFLGIGGIGMSAIARYFHRKGGIVSGYDRTPSPLTQRLEQEGIAIHYEARCQDVPTDREHTLVIYTPAIPADFEELRYVQDKGYTLVKRSRALGEIARGQECLAIAGTHGKTTTSTLLAHILTSSSEGCSAFLGGISKNYDCNLLISDNPVLVAEADEFDRSFLQLFPAIAAITSADADHLDIYGDKDHVKEAFAAFAAQTSGSLVIKKGVEIDLSQCKARIYRYAYDSPCDFYASDIVALDKGLFDFTLNWPDGRIPHCSVGIPGWINVENAIAASAVALLHGTSEEAVREALASFRGVSRRFDIRLEQGGIAYVDDYAHHPEEIRSAISSIRNRYPGKRICGVFQPHLYTRTRDFCDGFASALDTLDELILLPIYPARELPIPGVSSEMIFERMHLADKCLATKDQLMDILRSRRIEVLVTFGAGDIDRFVGPITEELQKRC